MKYISFLILLVPFFTKASDITQDPHGCSNAAIQAALQASRDYKGNQKYSFNGFNLIKPSQNLITVYHVSVGTWRQEDDFNMVWEVVSRGQHRGCKVVRVDLIAEKER